MKTRTKICGLTRPQDIQSAVQAGVDAIGLVFYPPSPRAVNIEQAIDLVKYIPPYVQIVGLFVNATLDEIADICHQVPIDILQFHGDESPEQCQNIAQKLSRRWYKAIQVKDDMDILKSITEYQNAGASAILLDAYHPDLKGGTGHCFDWTSFPKADIPLILAGGLNPENVADAIALTQPYAVDVSGGVEQEKGIKCHEKMQRFIHNVMKARD
ncbi:phosphoribosylanthranilate isomerase [Moraxella sp. ZY210820]|uniref:phosphoribosylanthranilate isomerase n=1 Tax=unclassified Moraxella TaxID=2685852 RepID=UPI00272FBF98|nr:phosphoribosylanthranilate isomerase [Moraxella sp. ZY210820]WLF84536.1 phosphoribosylanthranilate isomerase [Moraxella sp. ZY210820]